METINLQNDFKLSFKKLPHTIRLIILKNDEEWVCRKEKLKKLFEFAEIDQEHLFKGRLQLFKSEDKVHVKVKNEFIGTILIEVFIKTLSKLK